MLAPITKVRPISIIIDRKQSKKLVIEDFHKSASFCHFRTGYLFAVFFRRLESVLHGMPSYPHQPTYHAGTGWKNEYLYYLSALCCVQN